MIKINPNDKLNTPIPATLNIGDWSHDGHGINHKVSYRVNYPETDLQQAYKNSCKTIGVQFNNKTNYIHPGAENIYDQIWTEYQDNRITADKAAILRQYGILTDDFMEEAGLCSEPDGTITFDDPDYAYEAVAETIMEFIAYSMPSDFEYKSTTDRGGDINGWGPGLPEQFGYGVFGIY